MKNLYKMLGIIALGAVLILGLGGCPTDDGGGNDGDDGDDWKELFDISVSAYPAKVNYTKGEAFSTEGMKVTAKYNPTSVAPAEVTGFTTDPENGAVLTEWGAHSVTVSYTEDGVTKTQGFTIGVSEGTITTGSFTGTWGTPTGGRGSDGIIVSGVTNTGAILVYSGKSNQSNDYSVTLALTWGAPTEFTRQSGETEEEYTGFALTGTLSDAAGWNNASTAAKAIFGNDGNTLAAGVKIGIYEYTVTTDYDAQAGLPFKSLALTDGTNYLRFGYK
jgi:hypothetical protein